MEVPVLLDSAIGDNLDDAFALALACKSPEIRLLGVTIAYANTPARALLARRILGAFGRIEVPVATGGSGSASGRETGGRDITFLIPSGPTPLAPASPQSAIAFMAEMIMREARPVTLVATGPLTNVATLLRQHPKLIPRIERVVFMGGWSSQAIPEHNIRSDPNAAAVVLSAPVPLTMVGYETTISCSLRHSHLRVLAQSVEPGPRLLSALYRSWRQQAPGRPCLMHDPLTIALICRPSLVELTPLRVRLGPARGAAAGTLYLDPQTGRSVSGCTSVDVTGYLDWLLERLTSTVVEKSTLEPDRWLATVKAAYEATHYPGWSLPWARLRSHALVLIRDGNCLLQIGVQASEVLAGDAIYIRPGEEYSLYTSRGVKMLWIQFNAHSVEPYGDAIGSVGLPTVIRSVCNESILHHIQRILRCWQSPCPQDNLLCQASLCEILSVMLLVSKGNSVLASQTPTRSLLDAKQYIESNAAKPLCLDELARTVGLSKYHLLREFARAFGLTPRAYQQAIRMERAKLLLRTQHLSVRDVARAVGYSSASAFSRAFLRTVGMSPADYARDHE